MLWVKKASQPHVCPGVGHIDRSVPRHKRFTCMHAYKYCGRQLIIGLHLHTLLEMAFSFPAAPHWYHKKHGIIGAVHRLFFCISLMYIYIFCNQSAILWPITVIKSRQDPFSVIWRIYKRNRIFKEEKSILRIWNWLDCESGQFIPKSSQNKNR